MPSRIRYNKGDGNITIDFPRGLNEFELENVANSEVLASGSGIEEQLNNYDIDMLRLQKRLEDPIVANQFEEFWESWARAGNSFEYWKDVDLGTFIGFEGKSLKSNDLTAWTYTQALSSGQMNSSYVDPSTGLLTFVANTANTPRFPAGKFGSGLIIEGERTNLITHPSQFDNAAWTKTNVTVNANTTETKDPEGNTNADKLTSTAAGGSAKVTFTTATNIGTNDAAESIYLKSQSGTIPVTLYIRRADTDAILVSLALNVPSNGSDGNGFTRYSIAFENSGTITANWRFELIFADTGHVIYAYGAQLEVGTDVLFASSLISQAGTTTSLTRNAGIFLRATSDIIMDDTGGSISLWFKPEWIYNKHASACLLWIDSTNTDNRILSYFILFNGNHEFRYYRQDGSGNFIEILTSANGHFTQNQWTNIVLTWDRNVGIKLYTDGILRGQKLTGVPMNNAISTGNINIGHHGAGTESFGVIDDVKIFKNVLDETAVNHIFNRGRSQFSRRNYWPACKSAQNGFKPFQRFGNYFDIDFTFKEVLS